jgi:hypothetical protein
LNIRYRSYSTTSGPTAFDVVDGSPPPCGILAGLSRKEGHDGND